MTSRDDSIGLDRTQKERTSTGAIFAPPAVLGDC